MIKSTNDKGYGVTLWWLGLVDSLEGFDYDWMRVELAVSARFCYEKS